VLGEIIEELHQRTEQILEDQTIMMKKVSRSADGSDQALQLMFVCFQLDMLSEIFPTTAAM